MFPEIFLNYVDYFQPLNVFRYITFRTGGAILTALIISFLLGPILIKNLKNNFLCKHFKNIKILETNFDKLIHNKDTVFIKGSNSTGLYKFCKDLEKKYEIGE